MKKLRGEVNAHTTRGRASELVLVRRAGVQGTCPSVSKPAAHTSPLSSISKVWARPQAALTNFVEDGVPKCDGRSFRGVRSDIVGTAEADTPRHEDVFRPKR
jgi:hypothetical protein